MMCLTPGVAPFTTRVSVTCDARLESDVLFVGRLEAAAAGEDQPPPPCGHDDGDDAGGSDDAAAATGRGLRDDDVDGGGGGETAAYVAASAVGATAVGWSIEPHARQLLFSG